MQEVAAPSATTAMAMHGGSSFYLSKIAEPMLESCPCKQIQHCHTQDIGPAGKLTYTIPKLFWIGANTHPNREKFVDIANDNTNLQDRGQAARSLPCHVLWQLTRMGISTLKCLLKVDRATLYI